MKSYHVSPFVPLTSPGIVSTRSVHIVAKIKVSALCKANIPFEAHAGFLYPLIHR